MKNNLLIRMSKNRFFDQKKYEIFINGEQTGIVHLKENKQ